ncbi:Protein of unknown function [Pyronema omphalodes CBS 100304]|uniref:Uncharacterized protein n=1 Tax=Pyronema omphalodes (strain CBS 100304) TaxID=1076935 RepID=U4L2C2_PYROM|nr:Protein of unknown function [Pyronema omphalodes CBS 100304]
MIIPIEGSGKWFLGVIGGFKSRPFKTSRKFGTPVLILNHEPNRQQDDIYMAKLLRFVRAIMTHCCDVMP